jgi:hypothetical protein
VIDWQRVFAQQASGTRLETVDARRLSLFYEEELTKQIGQFVTAHSVEIAMGGLARAVARFPFDLCVRALSDRADEIEQSAAVRIVDSRMQARTVAQFVVETERTFEWARSLAPDIPKSLVRRIVERAVAVRSKMVEALALARRVRPTDKDAFVAQLGFDEGIGQAVFDELASSGEKRRLGQEDLDEPRQIKRPN